MSSSYVHRAFFERSAETEFKAHFSLEIDRLTLPTCIETTATVPKVVYLKCYKNLNDFGALPLNLGCVHVR